MTAETKEIEILRTGTHTSANGVTLPFTSDDLKEIATSYNPSNFRAPLIISHDTRGVDDKALHSSEFAFGAPKALRVVGDRLKAVFESIAPEFVQWVRDGKLLSVSSSIYLRNSPNNPTPGSLSLRHIAGLGKSPPAIKGMAPLSLAEIEFGEPEEGALDFSVDFAHLKEKPMTESDADFSELTDNATAQLWARLRDWLIEAYDLETADKTIPGDLVGILRQEAGRPDWRMEALNDRVRRLEELEDQETMNTETETETETNYEEQQLQLAQREQALAQREQIAVKRERQLEYNELLAPFYEGGQLTAGLAKKEDLVEFMTSLAPEGELSFSEESKSSLEWFKSFLGRLPKQVNYGRSVPTQSVSYQENDRTLPNGVDQESVEVDRNARNYATQHNVSYAEALTALGHTF